MQAITLSRAGVIGLSLLTLISCTTAAKTPPVSLQADYAAARNALEQGDYQRANRMYLRLAAEPGALQPRMRLELSHGYLRAGDFAAAAREAGQLAAGQTSTGRAAALAVEATARHELGIAAMAKGDAAAGKSQLEQAAKALAEVLSQHPEFDPLGGLAGRQAAISAQLKDLR